MSGFEGRYGLILARPGTVTITSGQTVNNALFGVKKLTTAGKPTGSEGFSLFTAAGLDDGDDLNFLGGMTV